MKQSSHSKQMGNGEKYQSLSTTPLEYEDSCNATSNDPHAPASRTTLSQTFFHLIKGYIGPGCLSQPWAYSQIGIINGIIATIVLGFLTSWNSLIVMKRKVECCKGMSSHKDLNSNRWQNGMTFPDLGEVAYGPRFRSYVTLSVCVQQLAICTIYFSFISDNIAAVALEWEWSSSLQNQRVIMFITLPLLVLLTLIKDLKKLAPVSHAGNICLFSAFALIAASGIENRHDDEEVDALFAGTGNLTKLSLATCAIMYSYEGICIIFPVESAMINPEKFTKIFNISMVAVCFIFASFSTFCVIVFGKVDDGSITADLMSNLEDYNWRFCILTANFLVSICILFSYPLQMFPAIDLLSKLNTFEDVESTSILLKDEKVREVDIGSNGSTYEDTPSSRKIDQSVIAGYGSCPTVRDFETRLREKLDNSRNNILRLGLVFLTFLIALCVPNVQELISLAGALSGSSVALIIPPLIELHFVRQEKKTFLNFEAINCIILLIIGVLYGFIGTIASLLEIFGDKM